MLEIILTIWVIGIILIALFFCRNKPIIWDNHTLFNLFLIACIVCFSLIMVFNMDRLDKEPLTAIVPLGAMLGCSYILYIRR